MEFHVTVKKKGAEAHEYEYIEDPVEALEILEQLRLQSGKFLYEYPARLRRVVEVIRR